MLFLLERGEISPRIQRVHVNGQLLAYTGDD